MNKLLNKINPVNTGKKWTEDEEKLLLKRLKENIDIKTIAEIHNRSKGGIRARCRLIAYRMHLKNIPIDEISDITKLNNDNIIKIIERKESKINKQNIKNFNKINPVNTGKKWTEDEEKLLLKRLKENINIKTIAEIHNRCDGGIRARCRLIAYIMHLKNIPIDEISDITKLNNDNIIKIIERKESKINKQNIKNFNIIEIIKKIDNVIICDDIKKIKLAMMEIKTNFEELHNILTKL